jgi:hypothetical protein
MPAGTQGGDFSPIVQLPPISNTSTVAIVGDIDITNDTKKVITKIKQNSQVIFLNGDFSYSTVFIKSCFNKRSGLSR